MPDTTKAIAKELRELLEKLGAHDGNWEGDEMPSTDSVRQIEHLRYGHRNTVGPRGISLVAIFGKGPWEEDEEADAIADFIIAAHNHLPALLDRLEELEEAEILRLSQAELKRIRLTEASYRVGKQHRDTMERLSK